MAGIFAFDRKVNLAKLFKWLGSVDGAADGALFEGTSANGKVTFLAEGSFVEDGGAIGGTATSVSFLRGGDPLGEFAGPAELSEGGLVFDPALSGGVTLTAGAAPDVLRGFGAGDDSVAGGGGRDLIDGAGGADTLQGGRGADRLFGAGGDDLIYGGAGRDRIVGGGGDDFLLGDGGRDLIRGGGGRDNLQGGGGGDILNGAGDGASDLLLGGGGNDRLIGDAGDRLIGEAGNDRIVSRGGPGVFIDPGPGANRITLYGGAKNGEEVGFRFGDQGRTVIKNVDGADRFVVFADLSKTQALELFGTANAATIEKRVLADLEESLEAGGRRTIGKLGDMDLAFKGLDLPPDALAEQFDVNVFVFGG